MPSSPTAATAELKRLAVEMVPIFSSRHIHREALAALSFLQQALAGEEVARVADYLKRAEHDPELRFKGAEAWTSGAAAPTGRGALAPNGGTPLPNG